MPQILSNELTLIQLLIPSIESYFNRKWNKRKESNSILIFKFILLKDAVSIE